MSSDIEAIKAENNALKLEVRELRSAVMDLCSLWDVRRDQAEIMAAYREAANRLPERFSMGKVERLLEVRMQNAAKKVAP